jgi:hypothetical protein
MAFMTAESEFDFLESFHTYFWLHSALNKIAAGVLAPEVQLWDVKGTLTYISYQGYECVESCLHSSIHLHSIKYREKLQFCHYESLLPAEAFTVRNIAVSLQAELLSASIEHGN